MEGVEVPEAGDGPGVAQVHVLHLAEEAAQLGHGLAVVLLNRILLLVITIRTCLMIKANSHPSDIVIYPHPPARVEAAHAAGELLHQVQVAAVGFRAPE